MAILFIGRARISQLYHCYYQLRQLRTVPYLMIELLPWSMLLLLVGSINAARFLLAYLSPCVDPGWASSASFLFWWQILSSPCKHFDYAASCILSCCSFYLEFTSLTDLVVTKEQHAVALRAALIQVFEVGHPGFKSHPRITFYHFVFARCKSRLGFAPCGSFTVSIRVSLVIRKKSHSGLLKVRIAYKISL